MERHKPSNSARIVAGAHMAIVDRIKQAAVVRLLEATVPAGTVVTAEGAQALLYGGDWNLVVRKDGDGWMAEATQQGREPLKFLFPVFDGETVRQITILMFCQEAVDFAAPAAKFVFPQILSSWTVTAVQEENGSWVVQTTHNETGESVSFVLPADGGTAVEKIL